MSTPMCILVTFLVVLSSMRESVLSQIILVGVMAKTSGAYMVELYAYGDVTDLSVYSLKMDAKTFTFPSDAVTAGSPIVACKQQLSWFTSVFGVTPPYYYYSADIVLTYGRISVELRKNNVIVDRCELFTVLTYF